ncbi:HAD-IA family hydrolase [Streptococcus sp. S784/96/1]|uniref:HAD-IA family hydrolase n=1 Tax=Streptococcus sp. S784/96/1 TaxID=2653499 RepID=UPI001386CD2A|nr:HAD-IA family hydrolase [Streptococcus sp. S784/96/1]
MGKTTFIWDFDGTLVESYEVIEDVLTLLYQVYDFPFNRDFVMSYVIETSIGQLLRDLSQEHNISFDELLSFFNKEQEARDHMISLMPGAKAVLEQTAEMEIQHFIYTHKGASTGAVLKNLGIDAYFTEVITSANGFKRKPDPEAVTYLMEKYQLDKANTYYIGDRRLDAEVAINAGIKSINLREPASALNQKIKQLSDLLALFMIK